MNPQKKRRQDSEKQQLILQRNSQLHGVLLAALLAVVLLVFGLVNLLHTKRDFSENENRKLQAYPALTSASVLDGSFMSKLQSPLQISSLRATTGFPPSCGSTSCLGRRSPTAFTFVRTII